MRLYEFEAKNILRALGIPVPKSFVVKDVKGLKESFMKLGSDGILKVQIPIGGRMKAGGIESACNEKGGNKIF